MHHPRGTVILAWVCLLLLLEAGPARALGSDSAGLTRHLRGGNVTALVDSLLKPIGARAAFDRLGTLGAAAVPALRQMLSGRNLRLVRAGLDLCDRLVDSDQVARDLLRLLSNRRRGALRLRAARLLGRLTGPLGQYLPSLLAGLADSNPNLRRAVAETLLDLASKRGRLLPELGKALRDRHHPIRRGIVEVAALVGPAAHPLWPLFVNFAEKGRFGPGDLLACLIPRVLPGADRLAQVCALGATPPGGQILRADSLAVELQDAEAEDDAAEVELSDQAARASSFEDIPAVEKPE